MSVIKDYEKMVQRREPYLTRARDCASLTIPTLVLPEGWSPQQSLPKPYQSVGAQGVASLASKLLLALFPPSQSFFRLRMSAQTKEVVGDEENAEAERTLMLIEQAAMQEMETSSYRPYIHEAIKQLLVAGNCLLHLPTDGGMKLYKLDRYGLDRDTSGKVQRIIIKETLPPGTAPPDVIAILRERAGSHGDTNAEPWDLYTDIKLDGTTYTQRQEVQGVEVPGSEATYSEDELPWMPLRLEPITGEPYGYGYISQLLGDLMTVEGLMRAITRGSIAAARLLWLCNPAGVTSQQDIVEAEDGGVIPGREEDVVSLALGNKAYDLRVAGETAGEAVQRMNRAFLLNVSAQRQAERVTAEEIRFIAQELESVMAGTYSLLSVEFQLPLVRQILHKLVQNGTIEPLPEDMVRPSVVTGIEALGRGSDLTRLDTFLAGVLQTLGPEAVMQYINPREYMLQRANALGLDAAALIKSEEQIAAAQQQNQMQSLVQSLGPEALKQMGAQAQQQQPA